MNSIAERLSQNKGKLIISLAATYIWGLLAHGYAFSNINLSHDSLREFHSEILGNNIKMSSGRVITPVYRDLFGSDVTIPWMMGLLALLWIGLSVYLIVRIFRVESPVMICLIAGVCTVNIAVSATVATYIHDLDSYMFSLLCAVAAVYLWRSHPRGWIMGMVLITVSLGIYQNFVFVAVSLVMMVCVLDLLEESSFRTVFLNGVKAVGMILLGGALYYLLMRSMLALKGVELLKGEYNSLDKVQSLTLTNLVPQILSAYKDWFSRLMNAYCAYPSILVKGITGLLLALSGIVVVVGLCNPKVRLPEKILCGALVVLLPLGMNMIHVLTLGGNHDLMTYPIWMFYVMALLLADWLWKKRRSDEAAGVRTKILKLQRMLCMLCVFAIVYGSAWFANGMYVKKDLEHEAYTFLMTRVVTRIEAMEEYVPGEAEVVFVGLPDNLNQVMPGFKDYWNVTGMTESDVIYAGNRDRFQAYFDYMMGLPIVLAEDSLWSESVNMEAVQQMPVYPASGFAQMIDGVLYVKLGKIA